MNLTKTLQNISSEKHKGIIPNKRKWICTSEIGRASSFYYVTIIQKGVGVLVVVVFPGVVCRKRVLKHFAIFTGKYLCCSLFLIKLQAFRPVTLSKRDSNIGIFL